MTKLKENESACDCGGGLIHHSNCGRIASEFLTEPTAEFKYSRRGIIGAAIAGGLATALTLTSQQEAHADLFKPSADDQKKAGEQASAQVLQKYKEVKDSRFRHFDSLGTKLVNALSKKDRGTWDYKFHVIESKEINAFAVPGGNMFMFTGLMDRVATDDELAAVTGHEMTHVRAEHWAKAVAKQSQREAALGILLGLTHAGKIAQLGAGLYNQLTGLAFSRKEEDEADTGGMSNMVKAGYDPHGMIDLFRLLQLASGSNGEPAAFLSDHPLTKDRIRKAQERIDRQYSN